MQVCEWDLIRGDSILGSPKLDVPPLTTGFLCSPFQDLMTFLAYNGCSSDHSSCMICITDRINFFLFKLSRKANHIQVSSRLSFGKDQSHNSAVVDSHFSNRIYINKEGVSELLTRLFSVHPVDPTKWKSNYMVHKNRERLLRGRFKSSDIFLHICLAFISTSFRMQNERENIQINVLNCITHSCLNRPYSTGIIAKPSH